MFAWDVHFRDLEGHGAHDKTGAPLNYNLNSMQIEGEDKKEMERFEKGERERK